MYFFFGLITVFQMSILSSGVLYLSTAVISLILHAYPDIFVQELPLEDDNYEHLSYETVFFDTNLLTIWKQMWLDFLMTIYLNSCASELATKLENENNDDIKDDDGENKPKNEDDTLKIVNYEDKYMDKYLLLPDKHILTDSEKTKIDEKFDEYLQEENDDINAQIYKLNKNIDTLKQVMEEGVDALIYHIYGKSELDILAMGVSEEEMEQLTEQNLKDECLSQISEFKKQIEEINSNKKPTDELKTRATDFVLDEKYSTLMNNYVMENTPIGNAYMRYNSKRKAFEYYSNKTMPYKYLETIGRKYVTTFNCKALFVDMETELKLGKEVQQQKIEEQANASDGNKRKAVFAQFKKYNAGGNPKNLANGPTNNISTNNPINDKICVLKEKSNTYTWIGRMSSFPVIKPIDKSLVNKNLKLTFAEFAKMRKTAQ